MLIDGGRRGGCGSQTLWFAEYGVRHMIMMNLLHSVDDVVQQNLAGLKNVDVIQFSIDVPLLRDQCIHFLAYCHNIIQHTPSVEKIAYALYTLTAPGGEFLFSCYPFNDQRVVRWVRFHLVYTPLRVVLSRLFLLRSYYIEGCCCA